MNADIIKIKNFVKYWSGHGYEKGEAQPFWLAFIRDIFGINQFTSEAYLSNGSTENIFPIGNCICCLIL